MVYFVAFPQSVALNRAYDFLNKFSLNTSSAPKQRQHLAEGFGTAIRRINHRQALLSTN